MEYQEIMSEFEYMGVDCYYDTLELSVLGHYLPSSLTSLKNCVNYIQDEENFSKSNCRQILELAAAIFISSSRKIFLVRNCPERSEDTLKLISTTIYLYN